MTSFSEFAEEYSRLAGDVTSSSYKTFVDNLERWFDLLDGEDGTKTQIHTLQEEAAFATWYKDQKQSMSGLIGSGRIVWPKGVRQRLGMQLSLFRAFGQDAVEIEDFDGHFLGKNDLDLMAGTIALQFFRPFAQDLLNYLRKSWVGATASSAAGVPASDRTVMLSHNSDSYKNVLEALTNLKRAVQEINDFPDPNEREQRIGEIAAGEELLKPKQIRLRAISAVLGSVLLYLVKQFRDTLVGELASKAIEFLTTLLGGFWLGF